MNRRRFLFALAALPIAAKFGGLVPAMPVPATIAQYSDFMNLSDFCVDDDLISSGKVGRLFRVHIEESSDVGTGIA